MSLIEKVGPDTIARFNRAAPRRFAEAEYLAEGGHFLAAIYFYGYCIEIIVGAAYFRVLRFGVLETIDPSRLRNVLASARLLSDFGEKSHPIDGLARLLVQDKKDLSPPAYDAETEKRILVESSTLREFWTPKLRYRAIEATAREARTVRESAEWFLDHHAKL